MFLGLLVLVTALTISAVAIYYSVAGLVAIFAAAAVPIMIMGGALEIGKLVTAVWLHRYWNHAKWWLKGYLTIAVVVLMFITSMGIFGFLSKAHIEQTAEAEEGIAQIERIDDEVLRLEQIIVRAETRIDEAEASVGQGNDEVQLQIDKEQARIDTAYERIQPAIEEQNVIIQTQLGGLEDRVKVYEEELVSLDKELARLQGVVDNYRAEIQTTSVASIETQVQPYKEQLVQLDTDLERINTQANEYEQRITNLQVDTTAIDTIKTRIAAIEESIVVTTNKLQSTEREKIQEGQAVIGVTSDGLFGGNTRNALAKWVDAQQERIAQLQAQETDLRTQAQGTLDAERTRLTDLVKDLRGTQTNNINRRKQSLLDAIDSIRAGAVGEAKTQRAALQQKIDTVLNTDIPTNRNARQSAQDAITTLRQADDPRISAARTSIKDLRVSADAQIAASNTLIQRLRDTITIGKDADVEQIIDNQQKRIVEANNTVDKLTDQKYSLQAEYRKLEAEVGPVKYLAEFVYGDTSTDILEEAVRWVIITIIFVFDPLAVLLLIASQTTFDIRRKDQEANNWKSYDRARAQMMVNNPGYPEKKNDETSNNVDADDARQGGKDTKERLDETNGGNTDDEAGTKRIEDAGDTGRNSGTNINGRDATEGLVALTPEQEERAVKYEQSEQHENKRAWKLDNPEDTIKRYKEAYIFGKINELPWEGYQQNDEQSENSIWQRIKDDEDKRNNST